METREAQEQIRLLCNKLGWSQAKLARELYIELYDEDDDLEIARFTEKLKKQLNRSSTSLERLEAYINIIVIHPDFDNIDLVMRKQIATPGLLPDILVRGLRGVSKKLTQKIERRNEEGNEE